MANNSGQLGIQPIIGDLNRMTVTRESVAILANSDGDRADAEDEDGILDVRLDAATDSPVSERKSPLPSQTVSTKNNAIAQSNDNNIASLSTELAATTVQLSTRRIANGLERPIFVVSPPGDNNRLFIVEQKTGEIEILDLTTNTVRSTPFLNLPESELLIPGFEQGLLGLAFHPNYANNGKFYINYTAPGGGNAGQTKIVEYQVSSDPNVADPATARTILTFNQPEQNHNGGWMDFGDDGYLYIASGDGGGSGFLPGVPSQAGNSQDITDNLLGKILRINVNSDSFPNNPNRNYAIPSDNPFVGKTGDDEIWVYGLRNPWRASFDRATGDLYIGDVGQDRREEIDFQPNSSRGGENYGWKFKEGTLDYSAPPPPETIPTNLVNPIYEYDHGVGKSVISGYVYRGPVAELQGTYFFADFVSNKIWSFRYNGSTVSEFTDRTAELAPDVGSISQIASFGEDNAGNLYIVGLNGAIFKLDASASAQPSINISNIFTVEGQSANAGFNVTLSQPSSSTVTVRYATRNGTAIAGSDYTSRSGTLTFQPGQTRQTITVPILDNNASEARETFDVVLSNPTNATIADGAGTGAISDTLFSSVTATLPNTVESLTLTGSAAIDGTGNDRDNTIDGNNSNNAIDGKGGNDIVRGRGGADTLVGGAGNDRLVGGAGGDRLTGSSGADRFKYNFVNEGGDRIVDFSVADDDIALSVAGFGGGLVANTTLTAAQFVRGAAATTSSNRVIYNPSNGQLLFDRDGSNSPFSPVLLATITSGLSLTNNDIFVTS